MHCAAVWRAVVLSALGVAGSVNAWAAEEPAASAPATAESAASVPPAELAASTPAAELAASAAAVASSAPPALATTEQPRSFGHVLGDVLTQRVLLADAAGRATEPADPAALPPADRVGLYLERRPPRTERDDLGRRWLAIDYQVINAPRTLLATALPALRIATAGGGALNVAAWPISIGPLTPASAFGQGDLLPLRPDRAVEALPTAGIARQLQTSLIALAAVLAAWGAWWAWRNAHEARRLPFAHAWHTLKRLDEADPAAWRALHGALNATAGRAVHGSTLSRLLADAPHLQPLQARLEDFFRHSAQRFFAGTAADASADRAAPAYPLRDLSRALLAVERAQHR